MTGRHCPYLACDGWRRPALSGQQRPWQCHAHLPAQRVEGAYGTAICLAEAHRRCPRLLAYRSRPDVLPVPPGRSWPGDGCSHRAGLAEVVPLPRSPGQVSRLRKRVANARHGRQARPRGSTFSWTQAVPPPGRRGLSRRPTLTEYVLIGLGLAVALAILFCGLAVVTYLPEVTFALGRPPLSTDVPEQANAVRKTAQVSGLAGAYLPASLTPDTGPGRLPGPAPTHPPARPTATPTPLPSSTPLPPSPVPSLTPTPTPSPSPTFTPTPIRPPAQSPPSRLVIARIGMDVPVRPVGYKKVKVHGKSEVVWDTLPDVACFHEASALPGHPGNTVINGHRDIDGSVFLRLNKVKVGDQIILYVGEVAYPYRVVEKRVTPYLDATAEQQAENLRLIGYMPEERLTLITCTPIGVASHRLYVIAKPPDSPPGSADPGAAIAR